MRGKECKPLPVVRVASTGGGAAWLPSTGPGTSWSRYAADALFNSSEHCHPPLPLRLSSNFSLYMVPSPPPPFIGDGKGNMLGQVLLHKDGRGGDPLAGLGAAPGAAVEVVLVAHDAVTLAQEPGLVGAAGGRAGPGRVGALKGALDGVERQHGLAEGGPRGDELQLGHGGAADARAVERSADPGGGGAGQLVEAIAAVVMVVIVMMVVVVVVVGEGVGRAQRRR